MNSTSKKSLWLGVLVAISLLFALAAPLTNISAAPARQGDGPVGGPAPVVSTSLYAKESPALGSIPAATAASQGDLTVRENPLREIIKFRFPDLLGKLAQDQPSSDTSWLDEYSTFKNAPVAPSALNVARSFEGLSNADNGVLGGGLVAPPDTVGAVGPNHYIQQVNSLWAIYDKDGALLGGPWKNNVLWDNSNTGDACELTNNGDPIVLYDQLADRWLISQFALPNIATNAGPFYECIAVSSTADPLGTWNLYTFLISNTKMDDYPKISVWPDGYYMSINQFTAPSFTWGGAGAVVFDRTAMLAGSPASMVYFDLAANTELGGMLPSNLQGTTLPPAGTPNYFVQMDDDAWGYSPDQLQMWAFDVDWVTPANSTFTKVGTMPTAAFDTDMCGYARTCIDQPGTAQKLDAISDRVLFSLQYRNFGTHESMVVNHTVDANGLDKAGVRWYEIRKTGAGSWGIQQQGTYAPDGDNRWMGSAAMDGEGNIAIGYSVSSASTYPSIRFTGRLASDPLGSMTLGETSLIEGTGSQLSVARWGDYSALNVDPTDDCTFWFTSEYIETTSGWGNWQTRVGSFKIPSCGPTWGSLGGTVTDGSANPVAGALVSISGGGTTTTDVNGDYNFAALPAGSYDVSVSAYGFVAATDVGNAVVDGFATVVDFALASKTMRTVSGVVTDGSGQGWPLYARIDIPEHPGSPFFTSPLTGAYSISLEDGTLHHFTVTALAAGYTAATATLTPVAATNLPFALTVDSGLCTAPGYTFSGVRYNFDTFPVSGWTTQDAVGNGVIWAANTYYGAGNYTGGSGTSFTASSDAVPGASYDARLISPVLNPASLPTLVLTYRANYQDIAAAAGNDSLTLDISTNGGTSWTNVSTWNEDHGSLNNTPGQNVSVDLSALATAPFQLRWRYSNADPAAWDWYAQIDDVQFGGCAPTANLGLIVGQVTDAGLTPLSKASVSVGNYGVTTFDTPNDPAIDDSYFALPALAGAQTMFGNTGQLSGIQAVTVTAGNVVTQNIALGNVMRSVLGDFDGNGYKDLAVFQPLSGTWNIQGQTPFQYGRAGDIPAPFDYNGDGTDEVVVFRSTTSTWFIRGFGPVQYGKAGDMPVPGDYNGDGTDDIAVYRASNSTWYVRGVGPTAFGAVGDIPVPGDYDGDGDTDMAVFRPSTGQWLVNGGATIVYGKAGDKPAPADYDGDGDTDLAVFRPSNSTWYLRGIGSYIYGQPTDFPVPGNYVGTAGAEVSVFRQSTGTWYIRGIGSFAIGAGGDIPAAPIFKDIEP